MTDIRICKIYLLTNKINGKVYVGQTWRSFKHRFGVNGTGYKECTYLNKAIKKYGWENFDHKKLTVALIQNDADEAEDFFINLYKSKDSKYGYNIKSGGLNGKLSEETKKKLSILNKGENNKFFGKKHTEESKQKVSQNTKYYHSIGAYDNAKENLRKFTNEEEKIIIDFYKKGNVTIQEILKKFDCSNGTFERIKLRHGVDTILQPKSEDHLNKMRANSPMALQVAYKKAAEKTAEQIKQVVNLREKGLLQKEIAKILGMNQVRVSQLLIKAGLRTQNKPPRKSNKSKSGS